MSLEKMIEIFMEEEKKYAHILLYFVMFFIDPS